MTKLTLDSASSKLTIHTWAEGMLSALAHDLELTAGGLSASGSQDGDEFDLELTVPVSSIRVRGTVKGGQVDESGLKPGDKADVEKKIQKDVLKVTSVVAKVRGKAAEGDTEVRCDVNVEVGKGRSSVPTRASVERKASGEVVAKGSAMVKLSELSIKPIKGPLGSFKLKDGVEVSYELILKPAS